MGMNFQKGGQVDFVFRSDFYKLKNICRIAQPMMGINGRSMVLAFVTVGI